MGLLRYLAQIWGLFRVRPMFAAAKAGFLYLPTISLDYRNKGWGLSCTGNVIVTTQPLETKPRARVVSNTGLADRDPKGQKVKRDASRITKPPKGKGSLGTNEFVASGLFPFNEGLSPLFLAQFCGLAAAASRTYP